MRRLGVYGENLPTKKERTVQPADFSIAGLVGFFDRKYNRCFTVRSDIEAQAIFGQQSNRNSYGWDCLNGFFANLKGEFGSIVVNSPAGDGAVQASKTFADGDSNDRLTVKGAYMGEDEYGVWANRTGVKITQGAFFKTVLTGTHTASTATVAVESVAGLHVGDVVKIHDTSASTPDADILSTVVTISESDNTLVLASTFSITHDSDKYTLEGMGFQIRTFRKSETGLISEVDKTLGQIWCTLNANDPDHYAPQVFQQSSFVKIQALTVVSSVSLPVSTDIVFLEGGTTGTLPSTVLAWQEVYKKFDSLPIRLVANCETSVDTIQKALEAYCNSREDNPIAVLVPKYGVETKSGMITMGNFFQRSDEVDAVLVGNWIGVPDPFSTSPLAPDREIPAVGHIMGLWICSMTRYGIHSSPARKTLGLVGINSVVGYTAEVDQDRTELAEAGVNVIQKIAGRGFVLRNSFTPSTVAEFRYANAVLQRNFIKISCIDALQDSENTPNTIAYVREDRMAVLQFMYRLWRSGSNGNTREGEFFGQYEKEDGSLSTVEEAFEVIADASNNSVASLQAGERNIDIWFMFPAPAGSIKVGVGLIYKTVA